jgi:hypothetical protein
MSAGEYVIASYKPKSGKENDLMAVLREHMGILASQNLIEEQNALILSASNGTILEIFRWKSKDAIAEAHRNPAVLEMWKRFEACCTYEPLSTLQECSHPFAGFEAVDIN